MVRAAHADPADPGVTGEIDRRFGGARHHQMAHAVVAIDQRGRGRGLFDADVGLRIDAAAAHAVDVLPQPEHTVGVGTGTDALAIALRGLGIGPGDEVITSPLSAAYSALAIMMAGARPVFADIDPDRMTIDPRAAAAAVTPRTAAIMP